MTLVDLGASPLANAYLSADDLERPETRYPLRPRVCETCWLVQVPAFETREAIFGDYLYFSSFSDSWLAHCEVLAKQMTQRLGLGRDSRVVEVASNDGYLLQYFQQGGIPVLGIEPAANVAETARAKGVPTEVRFMGADLGAELTAQGRQADLLLGLNVLAHVPDIHDFAEGLARTLASKGTLVLEFPHLLELIRGLQFDTIYHEHFSYLSLIPVERLFREHGLAAFDVERLTTHGGSLRLSACHLGDPRAGHPSKALEALRLEERTALLDSPEGYRDFAAKVLDIKHGLLRHLLKARAEGRRIVGYGAPAKGVTLLNYCGIGPDLLPYTVDRSPSKQGRYLPGCRIPIRAPEDLLRDRPDEVLILPWNLKHEIISQMADVRRWGGRFSVPIPNVQVL
jgi:SAM-dependent methyltransferase